MNSPGQTKRRWLRWLLEIAAFFALLAMVHAWQTRDAPSGPAPLFDGTLLDGRPVSLADFRGQPVLLHFWATWCPDCAREQGTIDAIADDYPVLSVAIDEATAAEIRAYMNKKAVDYPVVHDWDHAISSQYAIRGVPTSYILDTDGNIRFIKMGSATEFGLRLRLWWAGLL